MEEIKYSDAEVAAKSDDYSVCIMNNERFTEIDQPLHEHFSAWWPVAARTVIKGICADVNARRAAAQAILPILDKFPHGVPTPMRMNTYEVNALHDLYSSRLMFEEQYLNRIMDHFCNIIASTVKGCDRVLQQSQLLSKQLRESAESFSLNASSKNRRIIADTMRMYFTRILNQRDTDLKLCRSEHLLQAHDIKRAETKQLDDRISQAVRELAPKVSPDVLQLLQDSYRQHMRNIEHDMAKRIQEHCQQSWIDALR